MQRPVLFFSVSGLRSTGRSTLYENLKKELPDALPDHDFAFIGNPFGALPHPLFMEERDRQLHPTTRLLKLWVVMNQFCVEHLVPAIDEGKVIVSDGFGLDAFLYAISGVEGEAFEQVARLHHSLVDVLLRERKLKPPHYLLVHASEQCVMNWATGSSELMASVNRLRLKKHIQHEEMAIRHYFQPGHHQRKTKPLDAERVSHGELCVQAIEHIMMVIADKAADASLKVA